MSARKHTRAEFNAGYIRDAMRWRYIMQLGFYHEINAKSMHEVGVGAELQGVGSSLERAVDAGIAYQKKKQSFPQK